MLEHAQGVLDELVSVPTQAHIQEVQAKRTAQRARNVQIHDVYVPIGRHQAESLLRKIAVRIHEDNRGRIRRWHRDELAPELAQQARLALAGLGHQQRVAAEQRSPHVNGN